MTPELRWLGLLSAALAACAPVSRQETMPAPEVAGRSACVRISDVRDFRLIDRRRLLVFAPGRRRAYLLRIAPSASTAARASLLRLEGRNNRICGFAGDSLYFGSLADRRYSVIDVQQLDELAVAELLGTTDPERESLQPAATEAAGIESLSGHRAGGQTMEERPAP